MAEAAGIAYWRLEVGGPGLAVELFKRRRSLVLLMLENDQWLDVLIADIFFT